MSKNYRLGYGFDIVLCIDCTSSMKKYMDSVKKQALSFCGDLKENFERHHQHIEKLRVRIVAFRDYLVDGKDAMLVTGFFDLPEESEQFERCIMSLEARGGERKCKSGLEALAYAIKSKWDNESPKKRQIIVVWSDGETWPLGQGSLSDYYPSGMPADFEVLTEWWGKRGHQGYIDSNAKRLILLVPDESEWNVISREWENVLHYPAPAGDGMTDFEYDQIVNATGTSDI